MPNRIEALKPRLSKRDRERLERMAVEIERDETRLQSMWGDRVSGSARSSRWRDRNALRSALSALDDREPA